MDELNGKRPDAMLVLQDISGKLAPGDVTLGNVASRRLWRTGSLRRGGCILRAHGRRKRAGRQCEPKT
jgi:hypothetical protein